MILNSEDQVAFDQIIARLESLHLRNFGDGCSFAALREIVDSYELSEHTFPAWFARLLEMVSTHTPGHFVFPYESSDVPSLLLELQEKCGWLSDDQGEWIALVFPSDGMEAVVSFEALDAHGRHAASCTVMRK